jgi:hypothetical protein
VESLQSHCIQTQFHWSSGPPVCFPSWGTRVQFRGEGGYLSETGFLLLALSCYIGDPDVIDHCCLVWGGLCPESSLGRHANNVIILLDLTQLFSPSFTLAAGPPSGFTTNIVGSGGDPWVEPAISLHSYTVPLVQWSICLPPIIPWRTWVQSMEGYWCETRILVLALSRYITNVKIMILQDTTLLPLAEIIFSNNLIMPKKHG